MIRHFKLKNNYGNEYDLNDASSMFLHSPTGLGYTDATVFYKAGLNFRMEDFTLDQTEFNANLFIPNPNSYKKYFDFVQFCQSKPLKLVYTADGIGEFEKKVILKSITKTEIKNNGLDCPISLVGLGMWEKVVVYTSQPYENFDRCYIDVINHSLINATCKLTITNESETEYTPSWSWDGKNGMINEPISPGVSIVVDNTDPNYKIQLESSTGYPLDMYIYSDFSTERFIDIPNKKTSDGTDIGITIDIYGIKSSAKAEVHELYASV